MSASRGGNIAAVWFLRRHWLFLTLLAAGCTLRLLTAVAYQPALFFVDSTRYLGLLVKPDPAGTSPLGYSYLLLWPLLHVVHNLAVAPAANHALGVAMAIALYVLLRRWGVWRPLAAGVTAPVLLDGYQLQIEQMVMSDTLFEALIVAALLVLAWRRRPGHGAALAAGLIIAAAFLTRLAGIGLVVAAVVYLLLVGDCWRRRLSTSAVLLVAVLVPALGYASYYHSWYGQFRITGPDSTTLYARVAPFAQCRGLNIPDYERVLCDPRPPGQRPGPDYYHWDPHRPAKKLRPPPGVSADDALSDFARRIIRHQPVDFTWAVTHDFFRGFSWSKTTGHGEPSVTRWQFTKGQYKHSYDVRPFIERWGGRDQHVQPSLAAFLVAYQKVFFTRGTYLAVALVVALLGALGIGRARRSGLRARCMLAAALPGITILTAAGVEFSWRYQLPAIVLYPIAGALGVTALFKHPEGTMSVTIPRQADPSVDAEATRAFDERYPDLTFQPVVCLIAAYKEASGIGAVLQTIPRECCEMGVDILVVDDGSTDGTADAAASAGAYVCAPARNRGQGAALRLGYQLAREHGARYIVTTDADGQYDSAELPLLLQPLHDDEADFVTGSRTLGSHSGPLLRRAGTRMFAWLVTLLTGTHVTDTSFGFRAMRAEVTGQVTLTQPQYQSAELLIGVLAAGYRVLEQPMTMRRRDQGASKKGNDLIYGCRYARVVLGTWWRERGRPRNNRSSSKNRPTKSTA